MKKILTTLLTFLLTFSLFAQFDITQRKLTVDTIRARNDSIYYRGDHSFNGTAFFRSDLVLGTALTFGDGDTRFYENTDDNLYININSSLKWFMTNSAFGSLHAGQPHFKSEAATATNPNIIINASDQNTGLGQNALDQVSIIGGGTEILRLEPTATKLNGITGSSSYTNLLYYNSTTGDIQYGNVPSGESSSGSNGEVQFSNGTGGFSSYADLKGTGYSFKYNSTSGAIQITDAEANSYLEFDQDRDGGIFDMYHENTDGSNYGFTINGSSRSFNLEVQNSAGAGGSFQSNAVSSLIQWTNGTNANSLNVNNLGAFIEDATNSASWTDNYFITKGYADNNYSSSQGMMQIARSEILYTNTTQTTIVNLPANAVIWQIDLEVITPFNDSGDDEVDIGITSDPDLYTPDGLGVDIDVSSIGFKSGITGIPDSVTSSTNFTFIYIGQNGNATQGQAYVYIHYSLH